MIDTQSVLFDMVIQELKTITLVIDAQSVLFDLVIQELKTITLVIEGYWDDC